MNKHTHKAQVRKIIWATEKETGKRKTKKMIREANKMAVSMVHDKPKENWRESTEPMSIKDILKN